MTKLLFSLSGLLTACGLYAQSFAVGHVQVNYIDASRGNRSVPTEIYYPAATAGESVPCAPDTFPLVVFGHGFVMTWSAYQNVWTTLVQHGYVVAFPTTEGGFSPVHADFGADLAFLITALQQEATVNTNSILYNRLGVHSALMGHSMGGGSAFLGASGNTTPTTLVTFAAANTNPSSIAAAGGISIPSLVIAGQNDCVAPPAQHQLPMYDSLGSVCKAYVSINGGGHCYFAETNFNCSFGEGSCSPNPTITRAEQQDAAQDFTLMWLDYYLKSDCAALSMFNDSIQQSQRITGNYTCAQTGPVISIVGNNLQSTPALTYQWLLNDSVIIGANIDTLLPFQSGNYSVVTTNATTNCPDTSNVINWNLQNTLQNTGVNELSLYPMPVSDLLTLNLNSGRSETCTVIINDAQNRAMHSQQEQLISGTNRIVIPVEALADGLYILQLQGANGDVLLTRRVIVVHD